jgi:hypothetical protein
MGFHKMRVISCLPKDICGFAGRTLLRVVTLLVSCWLFGRLVGWVVSLLVVSLLIS